MAYAVLLRFRPLIGESASSNYSQSVPIKKDFSPPPSVVKGMPTNLPPHAQALWLKAQEAKTKEEKIARLQEFLSAIPDHKGTEKLRKHIRHQIAVLKDELEAERLKKKGSGPTLLVKREGALQAVLLGLIGSCKTRLFTRLTGVSPLSGGLSEVKQPVPGAIDFEGIQIQLVDTPPLYPYSSKQPNLTLASARNADLLVLVFDCSKPIGEQAETFERFLDDCRITLKRPQGFVKIERTASGGIRVMSAGSPKCTPDEVSAYLAEMGVRNAVVVINGQADVEDLEAALLGYVYKPSVFVVAGKAELAQAELEVMGRLLPDPKIVLESKGFESVFPQEVFKASGLIRVYTKPLGQKERSERPLVLKQGSTVRDVVEAIHSKLLSTFEYARVWGKSVKYQGAKVGLNHVLADCDTVEVHA